MSDNRTILASATPTVLLAAVAVFGLATAWWLYPAENHYSIMSCTISFLGSPDANRNPNGWRFYQVGMTALMLLLGNLVAKRHRRLRPILRGLTWLSSGLLFVALGLMLVAVWIPDSREVFWLGWRKGHWHTRAAILAIPCLLLGITIDGAALRRQIAHRRTLWPFRVYGILALVGTGWLAHWEVMCRRNPALPHWPGTGLHSTPLWEWIMFSYLVGFMFWIAHAPLSFRTPPTAKVRDSAGNSGDITSSSPG